MDDARSPSQSHDSAAAHGANECPERPSLPRILPFARREPAVAQARRSAAAMRVERLECAPIIATALAGECLAHLALIENLLRQLATALDQLTAAGIAIRNHDEVLAEMAAFNVTRDERQRSTTLMKRYFEACDDASDAVLEAALQDLTDHYDHRSKGEVP